MDEFGVAAQANWKNGEDVVIAPAIKEEKKTKSKYPKGCKVFKPSWGMTPKTNK
jgi:hypothetical protein